MILLAFIAASVFLFFVLQRLAPLPPEDEPNSAAKPVSGGLKGLPSLPLSTWTPSPLASIPTIASMGATTAAGFYPNPPRVMPASVNYSSVSTNVLGLGNLFGGGMSSANYQSAAQTNYRNRLAQHQMQANYQQQMSNYRAQALQAAIPAPAQAKDPNLAASDLMEEFIKYLGDRGVAEKAARNMPVDIFLAYIVLSASLAEGNDGSRERERIDAAIKEAAA